MDCASGEEQERLFAELPDGGTALMPLDDDGFSKRFAWVADRFGVRWQFNLAWRASKHRSERRRL